MEKKSGPQSSRETGGSPPDGGGPHAAGSRPEGVSLPSISAPKGGGAIRGIGEKFSVNAANGTSSLSIPIPASAGRSGFTPQLTLTYDSGSGNGPFGFGFTLDVPCITRKTDKGLPRYLDEDESDVFLLAGAEDLVPILDGANRVRLPRKIHDVDYEVRFYRPRIEGLFARIERWTDTATGISHWRTIAKNNVTSLYGLDDQSRVSDGDDLRRVFRWCLRRTWDDKGNLAVYDYVGEDARGVDVTTAHESNRPAAARTSNRYIKSIRYGGTQPYFPNWNATGAETALPSGFHFQIVFDYGDHDADDPRPLPDGVWPVRPDAFSSYRTGFEVRTYRRCERALVFHHFAGESGVGNDCLVRSLDFRYSDEDVPADPRNPVYTFLTSATSAGYRRDGAGYVRRTMPPLEFEYSEARIDAEVHTLGSTSAQNLPEGIDGIRFQFVDLDGEGLSGILSDSGGGDWLYKRNVSPLFGEARFEAAAEVATLPTRNVLAQERLLDLSGDGQLDVVDFGGAAPGFFERTVDGNWESFRTFASHPEVNWNEPNLKFIDVTGDGRADLLITEEGVFTFFPSLGEEGFGEAEQVRVPWDENRGPAVVFADGTQTIFLADMTGDGSSDIVRIRNGEVCYWPSLGYGRFGSKITMDGAPRFTDEERFDPRRIRLADIDGSGTADLIYAGEEGVQVCFNRCGNTWAEPHLLAVFPTADLLGSVQVIDLLGNGTACLVWSSPLPSHAGAPLRYVDLMGGQKPHLLIRTRNNLGAETRLRYAPSTRFYLEDQRDGRPWITRIPFPVHVVERVETYDWIGRSRFVTSYRYHHGYFDGEEREFRGFGMVEQRDTETHRDDTLFPEVDPLNEDARSFVPPVVTRTWFHTGAFIESGSVSRQYEHEYWYEPAVRGDAPLDIAAREAMLLPDTTIEHPELLDADEVREAHRALKGMTLRVETYAEDDSAAEENPYVISEQSYVVRRLQRRGPNQHAVFLTFSSETVSYHYERQTDDPRVTHEMTLECDDFGNVRRSVSVGYGRRAGYPEPEPLLSASYRAMLAHDQTRLHITGTTHGMTTTVHRPDEAALFDAYRAPMQSEAITAELTGIAPAGALFRATEMAGHWTTLWNVAHDIPYEDVPKSDIDGIGAPAAGRRIVEHSRTLFRSNDLTALLPLHAAESLALPGESYRLAFTTSLLSRLFDTLATPAILGEGGYIQPAGETTWWIPSGRLYFSPGLGEDEETEARAHFYQPLRTIDPYGDVSRVTWDAHDLLPLEVTDAVGNVVTAANDYRVLQPFRVTDPNGNKTETKFDALGDGAGSAMIGKGGEGDSLAGFEADLSETELQSIHTNPTADPDAILVKATVRIVRDRLAYFRTRNQPQPDAAMVYTLTRETHVSELAPMEKSAHHHLFVYFDGVGREAQHKARAEKGKVPGVTGDVDPRWTGSGWTIYDNKGNVVRLYEPFFTATHRFEFNRQAGVSSVMLYDPLGRQVAALHPDNTFQKTVFDAWRSETWDSNDTVAIADPRTDPHVGDFFERLLGNAPFTSWHDARIGGNHGASADEKLANKNAAEKAADHKETPSVAHFDSLQRTCMLVLHNGTAGRYASRTAFDTEGQTLAVFDARERRVAEHCVREAAGTSFRYVSGYDISGQPVYRNGIDSGERRRLSTVTGEPLLVLDSRESLFHFKYDRLRRLTHRYVTPKGLAKTLIERRVYGEAHADASRNLKGKLFRQYDSSGLSEHARYDFAGNLLETSRHLAKEFHGIANWSAVETITESPSLDVAALDTAAGPSLDTNERFLASSRFNALAQATQIVTPHKAAGKPSVIRPRYNTASLLETIDVWIRRASAPTTLLDPTTADVHAVTNIDYDAKGRRTRVTHGNGASTVYTYDGETFRLNGVTTSRPHADVDARTVQDLHYTYDPSGNITRIRDDADIHNVVFFDNQRVDPTGDYTYDAIYRLVRATGREHLGLTGAALNAPVQPSHDDSPRTQSPLGTRILNPGNGNAVGTYIEQYQYDSANNLESVIHKVSSGNWTRRYLCDEPSRITATEKGNRLSSSSLPGDPIGGPYGATYDYDAHGNMTRMPHLRFMTWDTDDRLHSTVRQSVMSGTPETTYYSYDSTGERVRKVTEWQAAAGDTPRRKSERIYLGPLEIHRSYDGTGTLELERETLHVFDDHQRVALVETRTEGTDPGLAQLTRYQYANHLESALLELDGNAAVISYEEYFPYGATAYQAMRNTTETPKRYRFTGKERDEENDLYYEQARYYAPSIGRWTACDPAETANGLNAYAYGKCNPINLLDPNGTFDIEFYRNFLKGEIAAAQKHYEALASKKTALEQKVATDQAQVDKLENEPDVGRKALLKERGILEAQNSLNPKEKARLKELKKLNSEIVAKQEKLRAGIREAQSAITRLDDTTASAKSSVPLAKKHLDRLLALQTDLEKAYKDATSKHTTKEIGLLTDIVMNEARGREAIQKKAIAYAHINFHTGLTEEPPVFPAEISSFEDGITEKRMNSKEERGDKLGYVRSVIDSIRISSERLDDPQNKNDPTGGATKWWSPREQRKQHRPPPKWRLDFPEIDMTVKGIPTDDFRFYKGDTAVGWRKKKTK